MNFKEAFNDDIENAYFDDGEFGSLHNIDGVECTVVITEARSEEAKTAANMVRTSLIPKDTSVNRITNVIYARDADIRKKITANSIITLDGRKCFVFGVSHTDGIYAITVGINAV